MVWELALLLVLVKRGVAQQAQLFAVGHDAPEVLGAVEILLHQAVRREAGAQRVEPRPPLSRGEHDAPSAPSLATCCSARMRGTKRREPTPF